MLARVKQMSWPSAIPDEEYAELEQTIPTKDEPFVGKYVSAREALIEQEKKRRSDYAFRHSLSPIAQEACAIVDRIRDEEQRTIWTSGYEDVLAQETGAETYPGMMFSLAKVRMEKTRLWQIIRKLPKGALLHAHLDAMVDFDFLFDVLLATPGMHIYAEAPLSTCEALEGQAFKFGFWKTKDGTDSSIWNSNYSTNSPILLTKAADSFPNGGRKGFLTWLRGRCTISNNESIEHHHGVDAIWRKFSSVFSILGSFIFYEPIFKAFMRRMLQVLLADGVRWVDLRLAFAFRYYREGQEEPEPDFGRMFEIFGAAIEDFKASEEGKGFWGARMIWTGLRVLDTRKVIEDMDACISIKIAFPHLIAGYDLVGQEDAGRPLKDVLPELLWFKKQCAQEKVEIPFFFHAGECLGDGSDTDQNLFDAILLGTRRIGHGFSLYKHPLLIDMVKDKKILVESCPISNEVLRLCASVMSHPLPALLARGVPCSLSNDDPAILGQDTTGVTHDFWQALQGWQNLGLAGLGSLAENSVRWAAFEDETAAEWLSGVKEATLGTGVRAERMKQWSVEWEQFCLWVVTDYGDSGDNAVSSEVETASEAQTQVE